MNSYGQTLDGESFHVEVNQEVFERHCMPCVIIEDKKHRVIAAQPGPTHSKFTLFTTQDGSGMVKPFVFENTGEFCYNWENDTWIAPENIKITKNIGIILDTLDLHRDLKTTSYQLHLNHVRRIQVD